jgi:tetraacyldisaccharide 4'-kinase
MRREPPSWWYGDEPGLLATALRPAGAVVDGIARLRFRVTEGYRSKLPVLCVGNLTAGGAGKTPVALALAALLAKAGRRPGFLTRGYGGRLSGPHQVDGERDRPVDVGDEALLLARRAPTILARNRAAGARALEQRGVAVIVMDDGLQNPQLRKQLSIAVVDPVRGIGNGRVMPAGPLRMGLGDQLGRIDAVVVLGSMGDSSPPCLGWLSDFQGPVLTAAVQPDAAIARSLKHQPVVAFAGIGRPSKLFASLRALGADVLAEVPLGDHHRYSARDSEHLLAIAASRQARLVTTEKDFVRFGDDPALADLRKVTTALPITAVFADRDFDRMVGLLDLLLARPKG